MTELVASHPRVDIDDIIRSAHGQRVIGYSYVEDKQQTVYFDAEHKALAGSLSKALPGLPLIRFVGASQDGSRSLLFAGSDSDPGRYYLYDRKGRHLNELFLARPRLEKRQMAQVRPVSVKVTDGTVVPACLTLPPGKPATGCLPWFCRTAVQVLATNGDSTGLPSSWPRAAMRSFSPTIAARPVQSDRSNRPGNRS